MSRILLRSLSHPIATAAPILRSQTTPLAIGALLAGVGAYSFFSSSPSSSLNTIKSLSDTNASASHNLKPAPRTFGVGPAFKSLELHSVEKLNHDSSRFRFRLPSEDAVSGLSLTSALLTVTRSNGQWRPVIRPYTPTSSLTEPGFIDLVVKRYPNGQASNHIHSLQPGDSLFILAALPGYRYKANEFQHVTMIAGGAGITPLIQLITGIFANPTDTTKVTLLFGINTDSDALFRSDFTSLQQKHPDRFNVVYTVTHPSPESEFRKGRVNKEMIEMELGRVVGGVEGTGKVFICGPPAMENALLGGRGAKGVLGELGIGKEKVFKF